MALTSTPANPDPGQFVEVSSTLNTGALADAIVLEITSVPSGSKLALGYLLTAAPPSSTGTALTPQLASIASSGFVPDVPGEYECQAHLLYLQPPASLLLGVATGDDETRLAVKAVDTGTVHVSSTLTLPIRDVRGQGADLVLTVNNLHIRAAELRNPVDDRSRLATLPATVVAALANMVDTTVVSAFGQLEALLDDLIAKTNAHFASTALHEAADDTNTIGRPSLVSQQSVIAAANLTRSALVGHFDAGGAGTWYREDDVQSFVAAAPAANVAQATVLIASMRHAYESSHRRLGSEETEVHNQEEGDATNVLTASPLLHEAIAAYLDALAEPTTDDAGEGAGAIYAATEAGFRVS